MSDADSIRKFIVNKVLLKKDPSILTDEDPLIESGIIDSAGLMKLTQFLEENFNVRIAPEEMVQTNFHNITTILGLISRLQETKSA